MTPRDPTAPPSGAATLAGSLEHAEAREAELRAELQRTYESLTEITSRLMLANEAAEAGLSANQRTELCERFLQVICPGLEVQRAAIFLVEEGGISVGGYFGLDEEEQQALVSSAADIDACQNAIEAGGHIADPELVGADVVFAETAADADEEAEEEGEEDELAADGPTDDELAEERAAFAVYIPVEVEDRPVAVLGLGDRAAGKFYRSDELIFARHLLQQFALALDRSTLLEQNAERLRQLDALVKVSREITSTLDLDAVLRAVVNTVGAVVENDRAEIALLRGDRLVLRAVSGLSRLDPDQTEIFGLKDPLDYLRLKPARIQIAADDLANEEPPPGAEVFREYFTKQEMRSFMGLPLKDDQGLIGFLCIESHQDSWDLKPSEGDALHVLAAQTTVAIRNATLYSEIPLRGVSVPVHRARRKLLELSPRDRVRLGLAALALLLVVVLPIFPYRAGGPAEVRPRLYRAVRSLGEGVVSRVMVRGGERVEAGQPLALVEDLDLTARVTELRALRESARREVASARLAREPAAWRAAEVHLQSIERTLGFEETRARSTELRAPLAGEVVELNLAERLGQHLESGERFCTVAALDVVSAQLEVPEDRVGTVRTGQAVVLKLMAFPTRSFRGRVTEIGWQGLQDERGTTRFEVRADLENPDLLMRPGMTGIGRVTVGRRSLGAMVLEPLFRAIRLSWW